MNGKQLKNSILQWAIQGKLVPQDPNDEPASVLLERIRAEKARLVKEGKIKKDKNESIIFRGDDNSHYEKFIATGEVKCIDDEIPFEIPQSWCWVRLRSIIDFSKSSSVKPNEIAPEAWVLDLEDIEKDTGVLLAKKRMKDIQSKSDKHIFFSGNVLYSKLRPYLNKVIIADENGYCTSEILAFDFGMILNKYAQIYLMSPYFVDYAMSDAYGVKMPRLGSKQGNNALIPLPPVKEQIRIAEQLANIAPVVNRYASSQSELDRLNAEFFEKLKKSILQEAIQGKLVPQSPDDEPASVLLERIKAEKAKLFKEGKLKKKDLVDSVIFKGDDNKYYERINGKLLDVSDEIPFDIPGSWRWARIKALFQTTSGGTPEKGHPEYYGGDIPWVKVGDLTDIYLAEASETISQSGYQNSSAKLFPVGTILVAMYCNDAIGKSSILTNPMTTNQAICGLYPNVHLCKEYIYYAIQANKGRLQEQAAGGAQKNINQKIVNELLLPIPPREEQDRIVNRIRDINNCL